MELNLLSKRNSKLGLYVSPLIIAGLLIANLYMIINHKSVVTTTVAVISAVLLVFLLFLSIKAIFTVDR